MKTIPLLTLHNGRWTLDGEKYEDLSPRKQLTFNHFFKILQKNHTEVKRILTNLNNTKYELNQKTE